MVVAGLRAIDPTLPFPVRLHRFSEQRSAVLERITPLRRVALRYEQGSPALRVSRRRRTALRRAEVSRVFAAELRAAGRPQATLAAAAMELALERLLLPAR